MRLLGLDPGLRITGWGVIDSDGHHLRYVAHGTVRSDESLDLARRLDQLFIGITGVIVAHGPAAAAVEHTYVNKNPASALKLGQARGVVLLAPAHSGLPVAEYQAMEVKKALVGNGHADKDQVAAMVQRLLPGCGASDDAADALAVAICHAHTLATTRRWDTPPAGSSSTRAADILSREWRR